MLENTGPVRLVIDPRQSRFTVKVFAGGPLAKLGHNPIISITEMAGEIEYWPEEIEKSWFEITIKSNSLKVVDDMNDKDRVEIQATMLSDVLEEPQYPIITFHSTAVTAEKVLEGLFRAQVAGSLLLHGVQRSHRFTSQIAFLSDGLRASGDFTLLQTDYNIKLFAIAAGALRLKDELRFTFDIVAKKVV